MLFEELQGEDYGVLKTSQTRLVQWNGEEKVVFSYSMRGKGINAHFATTRPGLRYLKAAIEDFCTWAFFCYPSSQLIFAMIKKPSVERLVKKCGFSFLVKEKDLNIYIRHR